MNFKIEMLLNSLFATSNNSLGFFDLSLALILPFLLSFVTTKLYMYTQKTNNYNEGFIQALFIFSILTSIITMIIGSNLARAFGLIGALSIIRFRNALKSPLDTIYFFWALSIGMACGTGFFMAAIMLTLVTTALMLILHFLRYGKNDRIQSILKVKTTDRDRTEAIIADYCYEFNLENILFHSKQNEKEYVYTLILHKESEYEQMYEIFNNSDFIMDFDHMNNEIVQFLE